MKKKAQHETIKALIGLVLVALLAFVIIKFIASFFTALRGNSDPYVNNLEEFGRRIKELMDESQDLASARMPLSVKEDHYIVAYDSDFEMGRISQIPDENRLLVEGGGIGAGDDKPEPGIYYKPSACMHDACICLFSDTPETMERFKDENIVRCISFPGSSYREVHISSFSYSDSFRYNAGALKDSNVFSGLPGELSKAPYAYVFFSGKTKELQNNKETLPWKVMSFYIERIRSGDKNFILILPEDPESMPAIMERERIVKKIFLEDAQELRAEIKALADRIRSGKAEEEEYFRLYDKCNDFYRTHGYAEGCIEITKCAPSRNTCMVNTPCILESSGRRWLCQGDRKYWSIDGCLTDEEYYEKGSVCSAV